MSPLPPPTAVAPYDSLESVLNLARTRLNDAIQAIGGDILTDIQPFTATMTNSAWRKLQTYLANLGYSKYKRKFFGYALPITATFDPALPNSWSWTYYFDGVSYWGPPASILPSDLICPLRLSERQTGSNSRFVPMRMCPDGLPEYSKKPWNGYFEWKNDMIFIPGSTNSMDFEVEYAAFDADFVTTNNVLGDPTTNPATTPSNMPVPIMRSQSALANYLCIEVVLGRDDIDVNSFMTAAESDARQIMNNSDVKLKQRTPVQRGSYSNRGRSRIWGAGGY